MLRLQNGPYYSKNPFMAKRDNEKKTASVTHSLSPAIIKRLSEGWFILILTSALFVILSLSTYSPADHTWLHGTQRAGIFMNAGGQVGAAIADTLFYVIGLMSYGLPLTVAYVAWVIMQDHRSLRSVNQFALFVRASGLLFVMVGGCGLLSLHLLFNSSDAGGLVGRYLATGFYHALNPTGAVLLFFAIFLVGITWLTGLSWIKAIELTGYYTICLSHWVVQGLIYFQQGVLKPLLSQLFLMMKRSKQPDPLLMRRENKAPSLRKEVTPSRVVESPKPQVLASATPQPASSIVVVSPEKPKSDVIPSKLAVSPGLPDLQLLDKGEPGKALGGYTHQELEEMSRQLEQHLLDFGIQADVVAVHPGPVITRFELQLAAGIKVSKLSALAKDLARSLSVFSVRVVEVIPGKTVVGLELPNQHRKVVRLSDVLSSDVYQHSHSPLTLALGVDISGHPMVVDLAKMPHLLVAGTTGSGKSVGINAMILSLLFKSHPDQVRLIMVDPKMLELSVYDGIPHLLTPVVTDMKEAASALRWCVGEMERRYRLMSALGVRNLAGYNVKLQEMIDAGTPVHDPLWKPTDSMDATAPLLEPLPYIVVIIDELADMMMVVGKKVEQLIARIAQKARASGIHLILATQRPSVDVLTGLIKSNIPTRISFQVSSKIDSRTNLDQQGAESLLGHGDMLYLAPGTGAPLRVHGAFVDDKEVHRIAEDWRQRGKPEYIEEITQIVSDLDGSGFEDGQQTEDADPLYDQAVAFVVDTRKASISGVQRRFKIGYNRAARLVEEMERTGVVGQLEGGFRDVLVSGSMSEE